jgi:hypothetical protein
MFLRVDIWNLVPAVFSDIVAILTAPAVKPVLASLNHVTLSLSIQRKHLSEMLKDFTTAVELIYKK